MPAVPRPETGALLDRLHRYLRDHNLPVTRQRDVVAATLIESREHLSVDALQRRLKARGETVGTATVYRTLDLMVASGVARAHDFGEGFRRFEAVSGESRHEHLICTRCGAVLEFSNEQLERMLPIIADEHAFQLRVHRVELYGTCAECQRREFALPARR